MQHGEGAFETSDGLRLFEQWWLPDTGSKAVIAIVHGYAEHSSRYVQTASYLTQYGYAVYAFDLRGHGKSEGERVLVRSFDEYLADLKSFLNRVSKKAPKKLIFLLGHSMGGTIATLFTVSYKSDICGLVLSGPLLKISDKISPLFQIFTLIVGSIFPRLPVVKKLNSRLISSDPAQAANYDKDPLVYRGRLLAREAREIGRAVNHVQKRMEDISLPLLILHGTGDHLVDIEGSKALYARARTEDKTLKLYEGFYHEVLSEPDKERVLRDIVAWLNTHV